MTKKRNYKIEIIRLLACIFVIWAHIKDPVWKPNGELFETTIIFEVIATTAVVTFFMITGFFIYNKEGNILSIWKSLLKKFIIKIFSLFFIVLIISLIFDDYIEGIKSIKECIETIDVNGIFDKMIYSLMHFSVENLPITSRHLWYIYSYFNIILLYPIIKFLIEKLSKMQIYCLLIFYAILMILNDIFFFVEVDILNIFFRIVPREIYFSICGYVLYNDVLINIIEDKHIKKRTSKSFIIDMNLFLVSIFVYLVSAVLLFFTQRNYLLTTNSNYLYTSYLSFYSLLMTISLIIIIYNIDFDKFLNEKTKDLILYLANKTIYVYLIHVFITQKFFTLKIQHFISNYRINILAFCAYYVLYGIVIFILSIIVSIIIKYCISIIKNIYIYIKKVLKKIIIKEKSNG